MNRNFVYLHRFHAGHRASLNGTRIPAGDFLKSAGWNKAIILLEDQAILTEMAVTAQDPLVSERANLLHLLAGDYVHPMINTVAGFMVAANTWTHTKYDAHLAIAGSHPEAAYRLLEDLLVRNELRALWDSMARTFNEATKSSANPGEIDRLAHNLGVLGLVPALLNKTNFLGAKPLAARIEAEPHGASGWLPPGLNVVMFHARAGEEAPVPFLVHGIHSSARRGSSAKKRAALHLHVEGELR